MHLPVSVLTTLSLALFATAHVQAAEPYYNPANPASPSGMTSGYELYKTIGCPGRGILEAPCAAPVAADAAPARKQMAPAKVTDKPAEAPRDSDGDGVVDTLDRCPGTVKGAKVDAKGCELDGDGDGVVDRLDRCPTTPAGRAVDAQGCERDGDNDGVVDALDRCPTTPAGRKVDAQGCERDGDNDGVVDALDRCPTTPAGRKVDAQGCERDGDNDGVVDALDRCPTTPAGRAVDAQGCERDGDNDGVVDAVDVCPGTAVGVRVDDKGCDLSKILTLEGVNFDNNEALLRPDSLAILDKAATTLKRYPGFKVEIAGHTDSRGTSEHNLDLSQRRAKAVMDYLIVQGVDGNRLSAKGYGETQPIGNNYVESGREKNRRVELRTLD